MNVFNEQLRIVLLMTSKSCRVLIRNGSNLRLALLSALLVLGSIATIFTIMKGSYSIFSTSNPYEELAFLVSCGGGINNDFEWPQTCQPVASETITEDRLSPSELLFDMLSPERQANMTWKQKAEVLDTITNLMMNGLPLVGMDDYILLSDLSNEYLNAHEGSSKILAIPELRSVFDNFLNVRQKKLIVVTDDICFQDFWHFMHESTVLFAGLNVTWAQDSVAVLQDCCEDVWAVLELTPSDDETSDTVNKINRDKICQMKPIVSWNETMQLEWEELGTINAYLQTISGHNVQSPSVTIRMHPLSVPDTRNIAWSPIKRYTPRQLSGQLLYFTSGFLSLQFEIQRYLLWKQYGKVPDSDRSANASLAYLNETMGSQACFFRDLSEAITVSQAADGEGIDADLAILMLRNFSMLHGTAEQKPIKFNMYHRAFPTHSYAKSQFWIVFGIILTPALIIYFSLPTAIVMGNFFAERVNGQADILTTLPKVTTLHLFFGWFLAMSFWNIIHFFLAWAFFAWIFVVSKAVIPALALLMMSLALAPGSLLLLIIMKKPDTVVLTIPLLSFLWSLPGLLYFELAFDIQRSMFYELLLCLLFPPSAVTMILRLFFSYEALHEGVGWKKGFPVSNTPVWLCFVVLCVDVLLALIIGVAYMLWSETERSSLFLPPATRSDNLSDGGIQAFEVEQSSQTSISGSNNAIIKCFTSCYQWLPWVRRYHYSRVPTSTQELQSQDIEQPSEQRQQRETLSGAAMQLKHLSKSYTSTNMEIGILSDINTSLKDRQITLLLGSNGAGKTTMMKIIAGFDQTYKGSIHAAFQQQQVVEKRKIGWCPQNDAIFEHLTVLEHVRLVHNLMSVGNLSYRIHHADEVIDELLTDLQLIEHQHKPAHALSGGMKRRLTLALALVGDPFVLILDEPTSGCDCWTREIVRKAVFKAKKKSAVLMSTHHTDDIDVLADHVWFLNENRLVIDDSSLNVIKRGQRKLSLHQRTSSTSDKEEDKGKEDDCLRITIRQDQDSKTLEYHARQYHTALKEVRKYEQAKQNGEVEGDGHSSMSISHPSVYTALCDLYSDNITTSTLAEPNDKKKAVEKRSNSQWRVFQALLIIRWLEFRVRWKTFFLTQLLLPFILIISIATVCKDASYPRVEISSDNLHGIGEICVSTAHSFAASNGNGEMDQLLSQFNNSLTTAIPSSTITFVGDQMTSNQLFARLFADYYQHNDHSHRWGAITTSDMIKDWLSIAILLPLRVGTNMSYIAEELWSMQQQACNSIVDNSFELLSRDSSSSNQLSLARNITFSFCGEEAPAFSVAIVSLNTSDSRDSYQYFLEVKKNTALATELTLLSNVSTDHAAPVFFKEVLRPVHDILLSLDVDNPVIDDNGGSDLDMSDDVVNSTVDKSLLMSQFGHAFLSNYSPAVHFEQNSSSLYLTNNDSDDKSDIVQNAMYHLYSHPLPQRSSSSSSAAHSSNNQITLQRGSLGATITLIYLMIIVVPSVRFIAKIRAAGTKRLFHMSGMSLTIFWLGNWCVDVLQLVLSFVVVFLAVYLGGSPMSDFFLVDTNDTTPNAEMSFGGNKVHFLGLLMSFAMAVTSSGYALLCLSEDQLVNQLCMLISSVCGSIVLKLFLDRQHGVIAYERLSLVLQWLSPAYCFASGIFDLFSTFTHSLTKAFHPVSADYGKVELFWSLKVDKVEFCILILLLQSVVYFLLVIVIDCYWIHTKQWVLSLRFAFSSLNYADVNLFDERHGVQVDELTAASGRRMMGKVKAHPDYRVGGFPYVDKTIYSHALQLAKANKHSTVEESKSLLDDNKRNEDKSAAMLSTHDLCIGYPGSTRLSLAQLNIKIDKGERVAVLGMNGGGKTTFFESLAMAQRVPSHGQIKLFGQDNIHDLWQLNESGAVGYVPQEGGLLDYLTVRETLTCFCSVKNLTFAEEFVVDDDGYIDGFLPNKFLDFPVRALSGGTRKKLSVRLANVGRPSLLMLDECTTGVDPIAANRIISYLQEHVVQEEKQQEQGMLFASHRIDECLALCTQVILLIDGQKYLHAPITVFEGLVLDYYQVDVYFHDNEHDHSIDEINNSGQVLQLDADERSSSYQQGIQMQRQSQKRELIRAAASNSELFMQQLEHLIGGRHNIERVVHYSLTQLRLTFNRRTVAISIIWEAMMKWKRELLVSRYAFREMDMEEALTSMLLASSSLTSNSSI